MSKPSTFDGYDNIVTEDMGYIRSPKPLTAMSASKFAKQHKTKVIDTHKTIVDDAHQTIVIDAQ